MTLKEQIMKLQTYKMYEGEDTVYVERDDVLKALEQQPNRCDSCVHSEEQDGSNCYECVKGMTDNFETQPTDADCISRQAVDTLVDELARAISDERCCMSRGRSTATIMQDILDLPSVTPQPTRWIPVSERLPKTFEFANCTCHSLIDDREDWVVETVYIPQPPDSPYSDWGNIPMLNEGNCEVVAWMHRDIPQPYKAESEE